MLNIQIKATNLTITPALSDYIDKKISSLSKLIDPEDTSPMAIVEIEKTTNHHHDGEGLFRAETNLHVSKMHFRAEASNYDLYAAIDKVKDELHRELSSKKNKNVTLLKRGGQKIKNIIRNFYGKNK